MTYGNHTQNVTFYNMAMHGQIISLPCFLAESLKRNFSVQVKFYIEDDFIMNINYSISFVYYPFQLGGTISKQSPSADAVYYA